MIYVCDYMRLAVEQAEKAYYNNDIPVGAVVVRNGEVLSACYNRKNIDNVAVYHAEVLSIIEASKRIGSWYLDDCDLYVTLKPCNMCMYAIAEARIRNVFYLMDSNYTDNMNKNFSKIEFNYVDDDYGYEMLMKNFFIKLRNNNK